jgi:phosphoserine aminotransferase
MVEQISKRIFNFSAGPCVLPKEILLTAQAELLNWHGSGVSVMEMSHRSKEFISIAQQTEKDFRDLMGVPKNFKIFFTAGGATGQFSAIPYNLLNGKTNVNYITTGAWSEGAIKEAKKIATTVTEAWGDSGKNYNKVPEPSTWTIDKESAYFHYCDNETIHGVEFNNFPFEKVEGMTLVCDMSSNMCSRPVDWDKYGLVYAGAQKNIGPAGINFTIIREDLIGNQRADTPIIMDYKTIAGAPNQMHNTPSCFAIYMAGLNLAHMNKMGGLPHYTELAAKRSSTLYNFIDNSDGYYTNPVAVSDRSRMNIPFRVKCDPKLEDKFLAEAQVEGFIELKGHRSVGGCRASCYNAMPLEGVEALVEFMKKFKTANP